MDENCIHISPTRAPGLLFVSNAPLGMTLHWDDGGFAHTEPRERAILIALLRHALAELSAGSGSEGER